MAGGGGIALEPGLGPELEALLAPIRRSAGKDGPSEYHFANLHIFREAHAYRYLPGPHPCVAGVTYDGARHLLPLFDLSAAPPDRLAALLDGYDCFFPVPARTLAGLDAARFTWSARREDADYLYRAEAFRLYRGRRLRKKRNLMKQLAAGHRVAAEPLRREALTGARRVLDAWMTDKGKAAGEADERPCAEALAALGTFGLEGLLYLADGEPAGFLVTQELAPGVHVVRFAKGRDAYRGIYPHMFHHFCAAPRPGGGRVDWVNFEQDLGLPNFRKTKLSYEPHALIDKYRVALR